MHDVTNIFQRKVNSLKVRCSDYKEGCEWVGELRDLHDHLDPAKGRCAALLVPLAAVNTVVEVK